MTMEEKPHHRLVFYGQNPDCFNFLFSISCKFIKQGDLLALYSCILIPNKNHGSELQR